MKRNVLRVILLTTFILLVTWLIRITDARQILRAVLERVNGMGAWAPFWFVLTYVLACLTFFPGVILTMGSGILFGVVKGTFFTTLGATLGAASAFLISRYLARDWVRRRLEKYPLFRVVDDAVAKEGWKVAGLIRLSPAFPYIPLNFVFGLTRIPFWQFVLVTYFAIHPLTILFVYLGSLAGDVADLGSKPMASGSMKWVVAGIGLASTAVVTFFVTRMARRILGSRPGTPPLPELSSSTGP
jgi:uncharacterized membrane protein YdjX (TVP38/TMEM64 family)